MVCLFSWCKVLAKIWFFAGIGMITYLLRYAIKNLWADWRFGCHMDFDIYGTHEAFTNLQRLRIENTMNIGGILYNWIAVLIVFLSKEIEETVEKLKQQQHQLTAKEKALKQKELEIQEREKKLEQQFNVVVCFVLMCSCRDDFPFLSIKPEMYWNAFRLNTTECIDAWILFSSFLLCWAVELLTSINSRFILVENWEFVMPGIGLHASNDLLFQLSSLRLWNRVVSAHPIKWT